MKIINRFLQKIGIKKATQKTLAQYKEELFRKEAAEQFKLLIQRGLGLPIQAL